MEQVEKPDSRLKIARMLQQLAIMKNQERSEKQIAAMSEYLNKHFSFEELSRASEYLLQRSPYFPDISEYFKILKPVKTQESMAIELRSELEQSIRDAGFSFKNFKEIAKPELLEFVKIVGWEKATKIYDKDAIEIFKSIVNTKNYYLGGNSEKQINQ